MKTISMAYKEYEKDLEESYERGYRQAFENATAFLESGKTPIEWLEMLSSEVGKTTEQWIKSKENYKVNFYMAVESYLKNQEKLKWQCFTS